MEAATFAASTPTKWKGLRIDLQVLFPDGEVWVDVGTVHFTRNSSIGQIFNWTKRLTAAGNEAVGPRATSAMARETSPVVAEAIMQGQGRPIRPDATDYRFPTHSRETTNGIQAQLLCSNHVTRR